MEQQGLTCLKNNEQCSGKVDYHLPPDRDDFKAFALCDFHWQKRLDEAEKNMELLSDVPPAWFDESYAGERWDEDY